MPWTALLWSAEVMLKTFRPSSSVELQRAPGLETNLHTGV
jgi:hypothetical protein